MLDPVDAVTPTIELHRDDAGTHWVATLSTGQVTSGWQPSAEQAQVVLVGAMREERRLLAGRVGRRGTDMDEADRDLYLWLCAVLG